MSLEFASGQISEDAVDISDLLMVSVPNLTQLDRVVHGPMSFRPRIKSNGRIMFPSKGDPAIVATDTLTGAEWIVEWSHDDTGDINADLELVVSALPTVPAPVNGQTILFQTMAMHTAGIPPWRLRYRTKNPDGSNNANFLKWEVIGDHSYEQSTVVSEAMGNTANVVTDFTNGLPFDLPLAGDYIIEAEAATDQAGRLQVNLHLWLGAALNLGSTTVIGGTSGPGEWLGNPVHTLPVLKTNIGPGTLRLRGSTNVLGCTWLRKYLRVKPLRVG